MATAAAPAAPVPLVPPRNRFGKVTFKNSKWLVLFMPRHICEWYYFNVRKTKVLQYGPRNIYYFSFHEGAFFVDNASKVDEVDLATVDRAEMRKWLGYEQAVAVLGPDLDRPMFEAVATLASDFFDSRCEWCEGTGLSGAHERIVLWESEIAAKYGKPSEPGDGAEEAARAAAIKAARTMPIEYCGVCRGTTLRSVGVAEALGQKPRTIANPKKKQGVNMASA
ncbi:hypothetical protein DFJ74DRAFT_650783 [Hyaloraphidium curvatum]|nr:hypothetical protein DFJ74DRAFT_650783 [Hyaloraphidium curvatum]